MLSSGANKTFRRRDVCTKPSGIKHLVSQKADFLSQASCCSNSFFKASVVKRLPCGGKSEIRYRMRVFACHSNCIASLSPPITSSQASQDSRKLPPASKVAKKELTFVKSSLGPESHTHLFGKPHVRFTANLSP